MRASKKRLADAEEKLKRAWAVTNPPAGKMQTDGSKRGGLTKGARASTRKSLSETIKFLGL